MRNKTCQGKLARLYGVLGITQGRKFVYDNHDIECAILMSSIYFLLHFVNLDTQFSNSLV